jgi:cell division protein FtsI (penicillin-binding protein 3)
MASDEERRKKARERAKDRHRRRLADRAYDDDGGDDDLFEGEEAFPPARAPQPRPRTQPRDPEPRARKRRRATKPRQARTSATRTPARGKPSGERRPRRHRRFSARGRINALTVVLVLLLGAVAARAFTLQGLEHGKFVRLADSKQQGTIPLPAQRGAILDRRGYRLASTQTAVLVGATLGQIRDKPLVAGLVARYGHVDVKRVTALLNTRGVVYVELAHDVSRADADRLKAGIDALNAKLPAAARNTGLAYTPEDQRVYPSTVASQVVGTVGNTASSPFPVGLNGVESRWETALRGHPGSETVVRDIDGRVIRTVRYASAANGATLVLAIDREIQAYAEKLIDQAVTTTGAKDATVIVEDTATGDILAIASATARPGAAATTAGQALRAVTEQYEPGSTFKPVTIAAALSENKVTPKTKIQVPSTYTFYDVTLHDAEAHGNEVLSIADILRVSSNIGTVRTAMQYLSGPSGCRFVNHCGQDLPKWIDRFGFGRKTGVDIAGEIPGSVLPPSKWSGTSILNVPIGQGIAVTPLQLVSMYATIANGGVRPAPHVVDRVNGQPVPRAAGTRVISKRVAGQLTAMLEHVVSERGTGALAAVPGYTVAGKTGTAQKIDPKTKRYSDTDYGAWFVGFAPAQNPRIAALVMIDDPKGASHQGGAVAAPVFSQLVGRALSVLGVPKAG